MRVVGTTTAARGVWRAYDYLYDFNPRAAMHVAEVLFAAGDSLANFPYIGRLVPNTQMRELVTTYPYILRYRITEDAVVILRVRHSSRRPTNP